MDDVPDSYSVQPLIGEPIMTFKLFASVYRDLATILNNRTSDHALELNTRSELFSVDASSFEEAQEMFRESDIYTSFCNDNPNRAIHIHRL